MRLGEADELVLTTNRPTLHCFQWLAIWVRLRGEGSVGVKDAYLCILIFI